MAATERLITAHEFEEMPEPLDKLLELVRGRVVASEPHGAQHARCAGALLRRLDAFVTERGLGEVFGFGVGYIMSRTPDSVRRPDVSFIPAARLPDPVWAGCVPFAPDLAAAVVSPEDRTWEIHDRIHECLADGTRLGWVLWPKRQVVAVHMPNGELRELGADEELDGGDVLPGFRVRVADLFTPRF